MKECQLHKFQLGRTLTHRAHSDFEEGYIMLGHGRKVKDFVKRTLMDAGVIYDDALADQAPDPEDRPSPPLPNMLINGSLVTGESNSEDQDEIMALFGIEEDSSEDEDD